MLHYIQNGYVVCYCICNNLSKGEKPLCKIVFNSYIREEHKLYKFAKNTLAIHVWPYCIIQTHVQYSNCHDIPYIHNPCTICKLTAIQWLTSPFQLSNMLELQWCEGGSPLSSLGSIIYQVTVAKYSVFIFEYT